MCEWKRAAHARPCGRAATDVDHVVPKVHGGSDDAANLQSLCGQHHRIKTSRLDRSAGL
jgi:5-methylcytosine-specific restriction endonuclease McrA